MDLKLKKQPLEKFLNSISKIHDQCILKIEKDNISCLVSSADNTLILLANTKIEEGFVRNLHLPDIKKLTRVFECVDDELVTLKVNSNNIEYTSPGSKFKYHLFEDNFLTEPPIKAEKIKNFNTDFSFTLSKEDYQKMVKGSTFVTDTNKVYFYTQNGELFVDLTDKARCNTDSYSLKIGSDIKGELPNQIPINFDNFKLINNFANNVLVSVNSQYGVMLFDIEVEDIKCRYVITSLTQ
jgi:hypothetical protein